MSEQLVSTLTVAFDTDLEQDQWRNGEGLALEKHYGFTGMTRGVPFRWKQSMSYSEELWMQAFASVDMDEIKEELAKDYYGIKYNNKAL